MTEITLYKINDISKLKSKLKNKGFEKKNNTKKVEIGSEENKDEYLMDFYYHHNTDLNELGWKNFASSFGFDIDDVQSNPRAVILIKKDEIYYAISFGSAYHYLEPLSDKEWAFDFAKRLEYGKINLMATTIPQSKRHKQISSYRNYNEKDINVGEALNKITAYLDSTVKFDDFGDKIQAGNSLKLNLKKDTLDCIANTISCIEKVIATNEVHWNMPHMVEVKDEEKLQLLNNKLKEELLRCSEGNYSIDWIDVNNYAMYSNDFINIDHFENFQVSYKNENSKNKIVEIYDELTMATLTDFITSNNIAPDDILDINIIMTNENGTISRNLSKVIIYDCVSENCIYEYGNWLKYNQEYIDVVEKEIATIPAKFCPEYAFDTQNYDGYLTKRINSTKEEDESYTDKEKHYNEASFNEYLRDCYDYEYYDADLRREKGYSVEVMDLYKDGVAYCVKKGGGASKLSYVVDQCVDGIKYLRRNDMDFAQKIHTVCIWLILNRETDIHDNNNDADINKINSIILKNKLVGWKQQMRLWGYEPVIRINYKKRNDE